MDRTLTLNNTKGQRELHGYLYFIGKIQQMYQFDQLNLRFILNTYLSTVT